jgi:hypothetical protein
MCEGFASLSLTSVGQYLLIAPVFSPNGDLVHADHLSMPLRPKRGRELVATIFGVPR